MRNTTMHVPLIKNLCKKEVGGGRERRGGGRRKGERGEEGGGGKEGVHKHADEKN